MDAAEVIRLLELKPHSLEGGFFRETYRSPLSTAIYYLLTSATYSMLHRLPGDEIFHFYLGDPVEMLLLKEDGTGETAVIGPNIEKGMYPQFTVPGNVWQGSRLIPGGTFALMGTTMAPGFDYENYEPGDRTILLERYPPFAEHIKKLTKE